MYKFDVCLTYKKSTICLNLYSTELSKETHNKVSCKMLLADDVTLLWCGDNPHALTFTATLFSSSGGHSNYNENNAQKHRCGICSNCWDLRNVSSCFSYSKHKTLHQRNLKTHQMFPIHTIMEEFKNTTFTSHFVFEQNPSTFSKSSIRKMFSIHTKM